MAKSKKPRRQPAGGNGSSSMKMRGGGNDAETLLKQDHRTVEKLFREFESADEVRKEDIAVQACRELVVHSLLEEELFYPACRDKGVEDEALNEAQVEHDSVKLLVNDLLRGRRDAFYDAKVTVLSEYVKHHVKEEERKGSGIFAKARKAGVDMNELGSRLQELKQRIEEQAGPAGVPPVRPRALGIQRDMFNRNQQESFMERDRDERGRFTDDDDNGRGRGGGRGEGRGWFGDSEGHSRAAQQRGGGSSRYDDDEDRSGRGGGRGHGRGGWFGDSEGHSRAAQQRGGGSGRYDDDDNGGRGGRGGGRGHGQGGWFGDSEGHSRAAQQRGSSSGRYEDDDDGGSRGGRGHGRGGWFGDPEGHSRAAQERGGGSGRFEDDDDGGRGGRGGGRGFSRERDEQGRFMSDDDDDRGGRGGRSGGGRGQGGWFGDPRGHSEASRRGWRDRD